MFDFFRRYADGIVSALPADRLLALDVFRGLTITAMVLVNNPGSWSHVYSPMLHAQWHGWTPTDLIFPFFVFIVGVSVSIVMNREVAKGTNKGLLVKSAAIRGGKLFALGLFLALFYFNFNDPNFSWVNQQLASIRVMGVLQRLGLVFVLTVLVVLYFKPRGRLIWIFALLFGYWAALMWVPYGNGGEMYRGKLLFGNNLTAWIDSQVFAAKHLYYKEAIPYAFDPEGLFSTLPAVASALAGVFTGGLLMNKDKSLAYKTKVMCAVGAILIVTGEAWGWILPINKSIWTSSYVVMSTGWALLILGGLTWLIDIKGKKRWTAPFVVFGANAIAFYMFSAVVARLFIMLPVADTSLHGWLYSEVYQPLFGNLNGSLMFAVSFCLGCYVVMHYLYKNKIFFKV